MSESFLQIRLPPGHTEAELRAAVARRIRRKPQDRADRWRIVRKAVDARRKSSIVIQYTIEVNPAEQGPRGLALLPELNALPSASLRPVVVGAGPAGLFATLYLATAGQALC